MPLRHSTIAVTPFAERGFGIEVEPSSMVCPEIRIYLVAGRAGASSVFAPVTNRLVP